MIFDHLVDECFHAAFMLHRTMLTVALQEGMLVMIQSFEIGILQYASLPTTNPRVRNKREKQYGRSNVEAFGEVSR